VAVEKGLNGIGSFWVSVPGSMGAIAKMEARWLPITVAWAG
jgi:hypothetical protein